MGTAASGIHSAPINDAARTAGVPKLAWRNPWPDGERAMIEGVRPHLAARAFEPFVVVSSSGHRSRVPTAEHAGIDPRGNGVGVWFDDGSGVPWAVCTSSPAEKELARTAK
jgi:hypothetical protein